MNEPQRVLTALAEVIAQRKLVRPRDSYTVELLDGGAEAIGRKVLEEAGELVEAARTATTGKAVVHETADLLYHVLVLLAQANVSLGDVEAELARRFGISGLEEKASRTPRK